MCGKLLPVFTVTMYTAASGGAFGQGHADLTGGDGAIREFQSDATGWMSALQEHESLALDSVFPGVREGGGCLTGPSAQIDLGALTLTITAVGGPCAISDESSVAQVSDADLLGGAISRWRFSKPIRGLYTFYGSLALSCNVTMFLYDGAVPIGSIRRGSTNEVLAVGHGFIADVRVDRIDFVSDCSDHIMVGAFVGLAPGETSLGTTTIPGYQGPGGEVVELDFAFAAHAPLPGDFDGDGDVDLSDFTIFQLCFAGSRRPPTQACLDIGADLDGDVDVDLTDFIIFQQNFTGSL